LSENPNAIHILEKHVDKIQWKWLSMNPSIFEYDYKTYPRSASFEEELMSVVHHPLNIPCFYALGFDEDQILPFDLKAQLKVCDPLIEVRKNCVEVRDSMEISKICIEVDM
jgi:hypothetical protein